MQPTRYPDGAALWCCVPHPAPRSLGAGLVALAPEGVALYRVRSLDERGGMVCGMHWVEHRVPAMAAGVPWPEEAILNVLVKACLSAGALALWVGCGSHQRSADSAMVEASSTEGGFATESIAESRCARESRCDNVGVDKKFSSMEDCVLRVRADWKDELSSRECPSGIDEAQLNECLNEIRGEECSSPFDTLARVAACTTDQICAD